jgi:hypothetical protein
MTAAANAGRGDDCHYHTACRCLIKDLGTVHVETEKKPIGFAMDGFPILALGWFKKSNDVCHTMSGQLSNEQLLQTNDMTRRISQKRGSIFHSNSGCYDLFFEADRKPQFRGRVIYYDLVTDRCTARLKLSQLKSFDAYQGPPQSPKGQPPTGK